MYSLAESRHHLDKQQRALTRGFGLNTNSVKDRRLCKPNDSRQKRSVGRCSAAKSIFDRLGSPTTSVVKCPAVSGSGECYSGKRSSSSSSVECPDSSVLRSSPMLEEHCDENTCYLGRSDGAADIADTTSSFDRPHDVRGDRGSTLARSNSECSMVTSTHGVAMNRGRSEDDKFLEMMESSSVGWTDDKHSSYLSSMEDHFVKNMYEKVFCAADMYGQGDECTDASEIDSAQSQPKSFQNDATCGVGRFRVWRNGGWRPVVLRKQFVGRNPTPPVLSNPWIKRFRGGSNYQSETESKSPKESVPPFACGQKVVRSIIPVRKQAVKPVSVSERGLNNMWQDRLQSQHFAVEKHASGEKQCASQRDDSMCAEGPLKRRKCLHSNICQE